MAPFGLEKKDWSKGCLLVSVRAALGVPCCKFENRLPCLLLSGDPLGVRGSVSMLDELAGRVNSYRTRGKGVNSYRTRCKGVNSYRTRGKGGTWRQAWFQCVE